MSVVMKYEVFITTVCLVVFTLIFAQENTTVKVINLCDKRPGYEPNGEHLWTPDYNLVVYTNWTDNNPSKTHHCLMRFSTCDYCRLRVQPMENFHFRRCSSPDFSKVYDGWCIPGCTYLQLYDRFYSKLTVQSFSSSSSFTDSGELQVLDFTTESRYLYVIACANKTLDENIAFNIKITAVDKKHTFSGSSWSQPRAFASPFFPEKYVRNSEIYKYVFEAETQDEIITINFDDWQLSRSSSIEFDKANIKGKIWGSSNRPWIISDSYRLEMTFDTGPLRLSDSFIGFRATYSFHRDRIDVPEVNTNCRWWMTQHLEYGMIMFDPIFNSQDYYDCIWVIRKSPGFQQVLVKVINFEVRDIPYYRYSNMPDLLEIRSGLTSKGLLVESAVPSTSENDKQIFDVHDSDVGFYVRIKGHYSRLKDCLLSYSSFNIGSCNKLFTCSNGRCIPPAAKCDGVDHCGDNSDEMYDTCGDTTMPEGTRSHSSLRVGIIIPIVVSSFLIVVICLLVIFIRRCRRMSCQTRRAQNRQQRISTVSGSTSRQQRRNNRQRGEHRRRETGGGHPHDAPPSYEDVLNTTPIGYLNLGYSDSSFNAVGLIEPPSYDEAVGPAGLNPAMGVQGGGPHSLSSDSSSAETVGRRSQLDLSSSGSSNDTMMTGDRGQNPHRVVSFSSSDSSTEGGGVMTDRQREGGGGNRTEMLQGVSGHPNSRHSLAKPEDGQSQFPVTSSVDISSNKHVKLDNKSRNVQNNDCDSPAIITREAPSSDTTGTPATRDSDDRIQHPSSEGTVDMSPMIFLPPDVSAPSHNSLGQSSSDGIDGGALASDILRGAHSVAPTDAVGDSHPRQNLENPCSSLSSEPADQYNRSNAGRKIPTHMWKARNHSSGQLMKNLSRSLNDLNSHGEENRNYEESTLPPRQLSRSVHNLYDGENPYISEACSPPYIHGQSLSLPAPEDSSSRVLESSGGYGPVNRQGRRSEDDGSRQSNQHRADEHSPSCPEPLPSARSRPQALPRTKITCQKGKETSQVTAKKRPEPRPRQSHRSKERPGSHPRDMSQADEGVRQRPHPTSPQRNVGVKHQERLPPQPSSPQRAEDMKQQISQPFAHDQQPLLYSHSLDHRRMNSDHSDRNQSRGYPDRNSRSLDRNQHMGSGYLTSQEENGQQGLSFGQERSRPQHPTPDRHPRHPKQEITTRSHPNTAQQNRPANNNIGDVRDQTGRNNGLHYRNADPPPYQGQRSERAQRPSNLHMPAGISEPNGVKETRDPYRNNRALSPQQQNRSDRPRYGYPPKLTRMAKPAETKGSIPGMSVHNTTRQNREAADRGSAGSWQEEKKAESPHKASSTNPQASDCTTPTSPQQNSHGAISWNSPSPDSFTEPSDGVLQNLASSSSPNRAANSHYKSFPISLAKPDPAFPSGQSSTYPSVPSSDFHPGPGVCFGSSQSQRINTSDTHSPRRSVPMSVGAGAIPFLSLQKDGGDEEEEDIFV